MEYRQLASRLIAIDLPGPTLDPAHREFLSRHRFSAVCLFRRNIESRPQLLAMIAELKELLGEELLIATDQEGGSVTRIPFRPTPPSPMALGAGGKSELSREVGRWVGEDLASLGIRWDLAPCLDVSSNPANPVIGERSFGSDPRQVAAHGLAWAEGLQQAGVMPCAKHFCGHGNTAVDSHLDLPTVAASRAELEATELLPFQLAAAAGIPALMTAHILYPALDPVYPATLSRAILHDLLRGEYGYRGIVVTDSTDMQAIAARYSPGQAAVRALRAGADLVLGLGDLAVKEEQVQAVAAALSGSELRASAEASLGRIGAAYERFRGASPTRPSDPSSTYRAAWEAGVTRFGEPPVARRGQRVLLLCPLRAPGSGAYQEGPSGQAVLRWLAEDFSVLPLLYTEAASLALPAAPEADLLLFATTGSKLMGPAELELAKRAFGLGLRGLHLALWNPYHTWQLRRPALASYGFSEEALGALKAALLGGEAPGHFPFSMD